MSVIAVLPFGEPVVELGEGRTWVLLPLLVRWKGLGDWGA